MRDVIARRARILGLAALAGAGLAGCGGDDPGADVTPALQTCTPGWQEIFGPRPYSPPPQLLVHGDRLYFNESSGTGSDSVIDSVPTTGGTATTIARATGAFLWVEGDALLFAPWGDRLQSVPLAGGTQTVLQDGHFCAGFFPCDGLLLDAEFLYFNATAPDVAGGLSLDVTVRRMSRATGVEEELALQPRSVPSRLMRLVGDSLLFVFQHVYVEPRAGGPLRQLTDSPGGVVSLDDQGALSDLVMAGNTSAMSRAPIDGGPLQPFWPHKRRGFRPWGVLQDSARGWVAVGLEPFDDDELHVSIWSLDAHETGVRLACDPRAAGLRPGSDEDVPGVIVAAPDAIYATVLHLPTLTWSIVRVAR